MKTTNNPLMLVLLSLSLLIGTCGVARADGVAEEGWRKVVFHVDEMRNARWALMLAGAYLDESPDAKVMIVTYGPGIDFLLEDAKDRNGSPYDPAVFTLSTRGVGFLVCAETLDARNIDPKRVLDGVKVVPSGIDEIVRLQLKEGYAYLKP